ncbi:GNAT family N-acetyltransferase [Neotabrizicola shimadae]|uniref:GNAT family N-acetyltransferase n=1 Tax=Neotabrizicola shimadae TaxID=2807096 RepID=A0A8G0ZUM0_9RHOB|nr:GNAT family protein [Neotabrizicola shimadae]QYZ70774.1 GNAT family N-acetyltransferase [Neotabrizicola shimadae]
MSLRRATPEDFAFIRRLAQRPENAPFISDEDEAGLAAYLADPSAHLLIWQEGGRAAGFALFCEIGDPSGRVELRRLALDQTGGGRGRALMSALIAYGFDVLGARRIWLDASGENLRAQHLYQAVGFTLEGRLRNHWFRPSLGRSVDLMLYGLNRSDLAPAEKS